MSTYVLFSNIYNEELYTERCIDSFRLQSYPFAKVGLMAPADINVFLTFYYGNYLQLQPGKTRQGKHFAAVEYGSYEGVK